MGQTQGGSPLQLLLRRKEKPLSEDGPHPGLQRQDHAPRLRTPCGPLAGPRPEGRAEQQRLVQADPFAERIVGFGAAGGLLVLHVGHKLQGRRHPLRAKDHRNLLRCRSQRPSPGTSRGSDSRGGLRYSEAADPSCRLAEAATRAGRKTSSHRGTSLGLPEATPLVLFRALAAVSARSKVLDWARHCLVPSLLRRGLGLCTLVSLRLQQGVSPGHSGWSHNGWAARG
mmetsp:Transcript_54546/g.119335  ORF Transcript_54546/g.119335 Transcript_54546/m.119335 type:complete len:227 (-) Transcript_54546:1006-1686(-)